MPPQIRDCPAWSAASKYVAHCSRTSSLGPSLKLKEVVLGRDKFTEAAGKVRRIREAREHLRPPRG